MSGAALVIEELGVGYRLAGGDVRQVVSGVSLALRPGAITGIVGESGCGKSTLAMAAVGWLGDNGVLLGGRVRAGDADVYALELAARRRLWGRTLVYLPQDAGTALHPTKRIGRQFDEVLRLNADVGAEERRARAAAILADVGVDAAASLRRYPHQLSGGQKQRVALALALVTEPEVLVLDEPTTGADATTQAQISALLRELLTDRRAAAMYISHDIALLSELSDELIVMYGGEVVEAGATGAVLSRPAHPYTAGLMAAVPRVEGRAVRGIPGLPPSAVVTDACAFAPRCAHARERCRTAAPPLAAGADGRLVRCWRAAEISPAAEAAAAIAAAAAADRAAAAGGAGIAVDGLVVEYQMRHGRGRARVLHGVSVAIDAGEIVGIVGESGSGKSTLLAAVAGLVAPAAGSIAYDGTPLAPTARARTLAQRRDVQLVFQDPHTSLNPRQTVRQTMMNALRRLRPELGAAQRDEELARLLELVRLDGAFAGRYPHQLSGGQKQRVALARALAGRPRVLLCDEVVSALDVSVQAAVLNLLLDIRERTGCAIAFVSHDLGAVHVVADRVYVLKDGAVVEQGATETVLAGPADPYTRTLVESVPAMPPLAAVAAAPARGPR